MAYKSPSRRSLGPETAIRGLALVAGLALFLAVAPAIGQTTNCAPTPSGVLAWWPADGDASDLSAGGHNGILENGVTFTQGEVSQAFRFDGTSGYVEVPDAPALRLTNAMTIEFWAKRLRIDGHSEYVVEKGGDWALNQQNYAVQIHGNDNGLCLTWHGGYRIAGAITDTNSWHHCAVVATNGQTDALFFIDGATQPTSQTTGGTIQFNPSTLPLHIGAQIDPATGLNYYGNTEIDELTIYDRALSVSEIQAIYNAGAAGRCFTRVAPSIQTQPMDQKVPVGSTVSFTVLASGTGPLSYQWQGPAGVITNATTASLTLTNVQLTDEGQYWVVVSNSTGTAISSNATLTVFALPPSIQTQPLSQNVPVGSTVTFTVLASGTAPLSYQWQGPAGVITNATTTSLTLTNVQLTDAGQYSVVVSNFDGIAVSSNPTLVVFAVPPSIQTQPLDQTVPVGSTVTFTVLASGTAPLSYQWQGPAGVITNATTTSLTLTNVQLTYAGKYWVVISNSAGTAISSKATLMVYAPGPCVAAASGIVSWWRGEGDATDASGANHNGTLNNGVVFTQGKVGQAFRFEGVGSYVEVPDDPTLELNSAMTIEFWIKRFRIDSHSEYVVEKGGDWLENAQNYAVQIHGNDNGLCLTWQGGYRIAGAITDTNSWHHCAVVATNGQTDALFFIDGVAQPISQRVGGTIQFNPSTLPLHIGAQVDPATGLNYYSQTEIDELTIYDRGLSAAEIQAIYNAGVGKCLGPAAPSLLSAVQNQSATVGANVTFTAVAAGAVPLSYQWQFNGQPITNATSSSLTLYGLMLTNAGSYSVLVSNVAGAITSAPAKLTVSLPPATISLGAAIIANDGTVSAPVNLTANGNENAVSFSLNFNASLLQYQNVVLGTGATNGTLLLNSTNAASGQVGIAVALAAGTTFASGTQQVAVVSFSSPVVTRATFVNLGFSDTPIKRQLVDALGGGLAANFISSSFTLPPTPLEGDVYPRPNGDELLTINDWVQVGRYVAGLDAPTNALEFQRADCAPRSTLGDGLLTIIDWVQAGRYAAGLDPATRAGGPTSPAPVVAVSPALAPVKQEVNPRQLAIIGPQLWPGQVGTVQVSLQAQGNESALAFSLSFDPNQLVFEGASTAGALTGATLNINPNQASQGRLGFALALSVGQSFSAGKQALINIEFRSRPSVSGTAAITFGDQPALRGVADPNASTVTADYINGAVVINPLPSLKIAPSANSVTLSWPTSATGFMLQESTNVLRTDESWSTVPTVPVTSNNENILLMPLSATNRFYRLFHP